MTDKDSADEARKGAQHDEEPTTHAPSGPVVDGTLAYVRALTAPPLVAPLSCELKEALMEPWSCRNVRLPIPVASDPVTSLHWKSQPKDPLCQSMLDFGGTSSCSTTARRRPVMHLQPYLSWGDPSSVVFLPHLDFVNCLKHLLLHTVGSHSTCDNSTVLVSHKRPIFVSTAPYFQEGHFQKNVLLDQSETDGDAYVIRCHFDKKSLVFGYHSFTDPEQFHRLHHVSIKDDDWRLKVGLILTNVARILNCLKDYTIPLKQWHDNDKLSIVRWRHDDQDDGRVPDCVQKIYTSPTICGIFGATVDSMIDIYQALETAQVPHTDRLWSVNVVNHENNNKRETKTICKFGPIGRCYLPVNAQELLDALGCVIEALLVMHSHQIMHRDIRWANVFHALKEGGKQQHFTREWILFDFEFASMAPQPAFGEHTLTPGNHAPEMVTSHYQDSTNGDGKARMHDTAVDIWGLGYLILNAHVDLPASHASDLERLQEQCLQEDPSLRPSTSECFEIIQKLQARALSTEKNVI